MIELQFEHNKQYEQMVVLLSELVNELTAVLLWFVRLVQFEVSEGAADIDANIISSRRTQWN